MKDLPTRPSSAEPPQGDGEGDYQSEFLSEASPDFEALRAAVAKGEPLSDGPGPAAGGSGAAATPSRSGIRILKWTLVAVAVVAAVATPTYVMFRGLPAPAQPAAAPSAAPTPTTGQVIIETRPEAAEVFVEGASRGTTPVWLTLAPGTHAIELRTATMTRALAVVVEAGQTLRESVELAVTAPTGTLQITSDPPGARVVVDGAGVGVTPLAIAVAAGSHRITVSAGALSATRTVMVQPGVTTSVSMTPTAVPVAAPATPATAGGWIAVQAPFEMQVIEDGQVIGTTSARRIMLPVGRHELELAAARFDFRTGVVVDVQAGGTVTVPVDVPSGRLSINAVPWAEVFVDGESVGPTPVANLSVPVGTHDVVFRHPQLGERRQTVAVIASAPARVGVDMTAR